MDVEKTVCVYLLKMTDDSDDNTLFSIYYFLLS